MCVSVCVCVFVVIIMKWENEDSTESIIHRYIYVFSTLEPNMCLSFGPVQNGKSKIPPPHVELSSKSSSAFAKEDDDDDDDGGGGDSYVVGGGDDDRDERGIAFIPSLHFILDFKSACTMDFNFLKYR